MFYYHLKLGFSFHLLNYFLFFITTVNGNWGNWGAYGGCSNKCGGGVKERFRACDNPAPKHGGKDCEGFAKQVSVCNTQPCPSKTMLSFFFNLSLRCLDFLTCSFGRVHFSFFCSSVHFSFNWNLDHDIMFALVFLENF